MLPWLAALLAAAAPALPAPDWAAGVADTYVGREWNAGVMACARTTFRLQGGALVGHYWVGDREPFEGDLTDFAPAAGHSGLFTWTDRFGVGVLFVRFAEDGQSFTSAWGQDMPELGRPGYGLRGTEAVVPGCNSPTS